MQTERRAQVTIPHNKQAEEAVLASLLIDPQAMPRVLATGLRVDGFYFSALGTIYQAMLEIRTDGHPQADYVLLCGRLRQTNKLEAVGGESAITRLISECATSIHATYYAELVRDLAYRRQYMQVAGEIVRLAHERDSIAEVRAEAGELLVDLERQSRACMVTEIRSAADILASAEPVPPDIVAGLLSSKEPTLVAGHGGTGKGYICLDLSVRVSQGLPWLGLETRKVPVLIIDRENTEPRLHLRIRRVMQGHDLKTPPPIHFVYDVATRLDQASFVDEVVGLAERTSAGLIILDSLADFLGGLDENSNPNMALAAEHLRAIAATSGAALLAQHHTPKYSAGKASQSARGASSLFDGVHAVIQLIRDGDLVTLTQEKNRGGPEITIKARMNWTADAFNLSPLSVTSGRQARKRDEDEVAILRALEDGKWHWSNELVAAVMSLSTHARRTIHRKLKLLIEDQVLVVDEQVDGKPYMVRTRSGGKLL